MSKTITPIKCPQCGSTEKETQTHSLFKCTMCHTQYQIEDDSQIQINTMPETVPLTEELKQELLRYGNPSMRAFNEKIQRNIDKKYTFLFLFTLLILFLVVYFGFAVYHIGSFKGFVTMLKNPNPKITQTITYDPNNDQSTEIEASNDEYSLGKITYNSTREINMVVASSNIASPKDFGIIRRYTYVDSFHDNSIPTQYLFQVNDLLTDKTLYEVPLDDYLEGRDFEAANDLRTLTSINTFEFVMINSEHLYLIIFEDQILKIDPKTFELTDVTNAYLGKFEELNLGIASINPNEDESFKIKTASNELYYYYPLSGKLFDDDTFNNGIKNDPNIKKTYSYYIDRSSDDNQKLMRRQIKYNKFAPYYEPIHHFSKNKGTDFTPGRIYFSPIILNVNSEQIIIEDRINAIANSGYKIEALDAKNGKVLWSYEYQDSPSLIPVENGYLIYIVSTKDYIADHISFDGTFIGKKELNFIPYLQKSS